MAGDTGVELLPPHDKGELLNTILPRVIGRVHEELGEEKKPGAFGGACGFASFMAEHLILYAGLDQLREGVQTKVVNTLWLHSTAMGLSTEEVAQQIAKIYALIEYPDVYNYAFQHTIVLAQAGGKFILVDPTFCQFIDPKSGMVRNGNLSSGILANDPTAGSLYTNGYIELTDELMRQYLLLTSNQDHHSAIPDSVSVADLYQRTVRTPADFNKQELDQRLFQ